MHKRILGGGVEPTNSRRRALVLTTKLASHSCHVGDSIGCSVCFASFPPRPNYPQPQVTSRKRWVDGYFVVLVRNFLKSWEMCVLILMVAMSICMLVEGDDEFFICLIESHKTQIHVLKKIPFMKTVNYC